MKINLFILTFAVFLIGLSYESPLAKNEKTYYVPPPPGLKYISLGYNEVIADLLWIRSIQDSSTCEQNEDKNFQVIEGKQAEDIVKEKLGPSKCHLGWYYKMIDAVTELSPKFYLAYRVGSTLLSIAIDDREGAKRIFDKGLVAFPNDWVIAYRAAYHYLYEYQDGQRAADLLLQANQNGGPSWFPVLAARLYTTVGKATLGIAVLEEFLKSNPDSHARGRAEKRLEILRKQLQEPAK